MAHPWWYSLSTSYDLLSFLCLMSSLIILTDSSPIVRTYVATDVSACHSFAQLNVVWCRMCHLHVHHEQLPHEDCGTIVYLCKLDTSHCILSSCIKVFLHKILFGSCQMTSLCRYNLQKHTLESWRNPSLSFYAWYMYFKCLPTYTLLNETAYSNGRGNKHSHPQMWHKSSLGYDVLTCLPW